MKVHDSALSWRAECLVSSAAFVKNGGELPRLGWTWVLRPAQMKSVILLLIVNAKIAKKAIVIYGNGRILRNESYRSHRKILTIL